MPAGADAGLKRDSSLNSGYEFHWCEFLSAIVDAAMSYKWRLYAADFSEFGCLKLPEARTTFPLLQSPLQRSAGGHALASSDTSAHAAMTKTASRKVEQRNPTQCSGPIARLQPRST
jgi:hypothetical protein